MDRYIAPRIEGKSYPMDIPLGSRFKFEESREEFIKITETSYIRPDTFDAWTKGQRVPTLSFGTDQPIIIARLPGNTTIDAIEGRLLQDVNESGKEWRRRDVDTLITRSRQLLAERMTTESDQH